MARKVFFSFYYDRDVWRVSQVRNSNVVTSSYEQTKFLDGAAWESIKRNGRQAVKDWIDSQLHGTSVTVVLIGAETASREWVNYEIEQSWKRGNGVLGIYIHNIQNQFKQTDSKGANPFSSHKIGPGFFDTLNYHVKTYDWVNDDGRTNIGSWIEAAAKARGR